MSAPAPVVAELSKFDDARHRAARAQHGQLSEVAPRKRNTNFQFTTADALLAEPKEEAAWVIDRMFRCGSFSILAAKPKAGKTTLAFAIAVSVSNGHAFFGRQTQPGKVLLLCLEEHREEVAERLRRMGANGENIIIHTGAAPEDALIALDLAIEEHAPALVIIDPLSRFIRVSDFNSYAEVTRQLEPLIDLARLSKCQTHVLALHHNGKGGDLRDGIDATLGSTAISAAVDTLLTMRKREKIRTVESTQRHGEDLSETIVHLDESGIISSHGDLKEFTLTERKEAVLSVMTSDFVSEGAIKDLVGGTNAGLTSKAVRALFDEGKLDRIGGGRKGDPFLYSIPSVALPDEIVIPAGLPNDEESIRRGFA